MPYKYIGRKTDFRGKSLWEIVGNLKNFGVGRIVVRSRMERYPEPTYLKILKVEPVSVPETPSIDDVRKVQVLVERTFRGVKEEPLWMFSSTYKTDYRLLPKDAEEAYCNKKEMYKFERILPKTMECTPLLKELLIREQRAKGEPETDHRIDVVYRANSKYKIAENDEDATVQFVAGLGETPHKSLYANIKK